MPTAASAALERVCSRCLRHELNCCHLPFLDLPTVLRRRKNKARVSLGVHPIREWLDPEAMRMVSRRDLELYSRTLLDADDGLNSYFFAVTSITRTPSVSLGDAFAGPATVLLVRGSIAAINSKASN
jgi:hypothetical protein